LSNIRKANGTSAPLQRVIVALLQACRSLPPQHDTLCITRWLLLLLLLLLLCARMGYRTLQDCYFLLGAGAAAGKEIKSWRRV
jgi:hypothetical protein